MIPGPCAVQVNAALLVDSPEVYKDSAVPFFRQGKCAAVV